ncbi:MAG: efflux RND transporter permease subunit, partial [Acidobacteria bacterium]|nr:efflux RND transporter permease subunit [Acidobacteriota bacterium]
MTISLASNRSVREATEFADKVLRRQIESISGVGQVQIVGGRKRQINVNLDGDKLRGYNLTVAQVVAALQAQNLEVPGGRIDQQDRFLTLRTLGRLPDVPSFNRIVVASRGSYPIRISDLGYVEDGVEDELSVGRFNDTPALLLQIRRQSGTNTVDVVNGIKARLDELKSSIPPGYDVKVVRDQSVFILAAFDTIREHLVIGSLLAALVVLLFMQNIRATLIAAIAIPTSLISTFAAMEWADITLNGPSMLGLTLAVGIVIDDAIVVLENIFRYLEEKEMGPLEAAIEATREIGLAVMATTLSLVVIFLPVAFMSSIPGRFFKSIALTMAFSIMVSLLVSFTLTPMMSAKLLRRVKRKAEGDGEEAAIPAEGRAHEKSNFLNRALDHGYAMLLKFSLRHRWVIVTIALLVFLSSVPLLMAVGKDFFPEDDQDEFEVSIRAAEGTSLQSTLSIAQKVASDVRQLPHIDYTLTTIGDDPQQTPNEAKIYVRLAPLKTRDISQFELMSQVRGKVLPKYAPLNLRPVVSTVAAIGGNSRQNANIAFTIQGPDLERLNVYSQDLLTRLKAMPGVVDADTSLIYGKPEMRAEIDRARASDLGVNVLDIAQSLRLLVGGDQISTYNENGEQYEVHIRANETYRSTATGIGKLNVPSMRLGSVGLDNVVRFTEASGPTQIERVARQRQVLLTANLEQGFSQSEIIDQINAEVKKMNLPPDYLTGLSGRTKELKRTLDGFILAFLLSFIFMYIVLAAQFESFIHPVTVLLALPLSLPFALLSLFIAGQ